MTGPYEPEVDEPEVKEELAMSESKGLRVLVWTIIPWSGTVCAGCWRTRESSR